ncbi:phage regulatory CII family protein [Acinetobacter tandoii]|uniref:phage regulatory CII family protein n=1 Tax=Acinetobacter tandoii TaxID=202954 RepID=UPI0030160C74
MSDFLSNFAAENAVLPLDVAIYRACKDRHGSKAAIAEINGFNPMVFSKCVDINNSQYHLHPEHIEAVLKYTGDVRILESLAAAHGHAVVYELPSNIDILDTGFLANIGEVSNRVGELFSTVSDSLKDGRIIEVELATIEKDAMCLIAAVAQLKKLARQKAEHDAGEK